MMDELTLDDVNAAIKRHLQHENLKIAIVTGDAANLREKCWQATHRRRSRYATPKPDAILAEDRTIAAWPLALPRSASRSCRSPAPSSVSSQGFAGRELRERVDDELALALLHARRERFLTESVGKATGTRHCATTRPVS